MEKQRLFINYFLTWMVSFKLSKLIFWFFIFLIFLSIFNHFYISDINETNQPLNKEIDLSIKNDMFYQKYNLHDFESILKNDNLELRLKELFKIRESVLNELTALESRRQKQQKDMNIFSVKLDELKSQINHKQNELTRIHISLEQAEYSQKEAVSKNRPIISNPLRILDNEFLKNKSFVNEINVSQRILNNKNFCSMHSCFDYSKCSIAKKIKVFIDSTFLKKIKNEFNDQIQEEFNNKINLNFKTVTNLNEACLIFVPVIKNFDPNYFNQNYFNQKNVFIINFSETEIKSLLNYQTIIIQENFFIDTFRENYDIILPSINYIKENFKNNQDLTSTTIHYPHCPAKKKYFWSCIDNLEENLKNNKTFEVKNHLSKLLLSLYNNTNNKIDNFYMNFSFAVKKILDRNILKLYSESTFSLILPNEDSSQISSQEMNLKLTSILSTSSIPVILGKFQAKLPFNEVIDWNRAVIQIPTARISEVYYILKTFSDNDILEMKKNGKMLYERYLSNFNNLISSIFSLIKSERLQIPINEISDDFVSLIYDKNENKMSFYEINNEVLELNNEIEDNLGPIEPQQASISYQRNFSLILTNSYKIWNTDQFNPFFMFPFTPFDPVLPSEAKFLGSNYGFRPIKNGLGGSGKEFSESLGGNYPKEQFTIVMLTFERESVLMDSLQRLKGLPYLNKIVIIWNSKKLPDKEIKWPEIGVEIVVIKAEKNSLNNRFKPYKVIETEAILSMDDDVHLRHDEIIFGFRAWRESRDQIVGFPARYHAWSKIEREWFYNSNYSCELSMVLTGAAFFHKYYSYVYTNLMNSLIKKKVDEYMNCEDIAMNFLVSHLTRKPPLKVTSRWTFRCPACPASLSEDDSHFEERHRCVNFFTSLYGYNPLLYTQYRADSVLFKTRIPQNKQKCFKLI